MPWTWGGGGPSVPLIFCGSRDPGALAWPHVLDPVCPFDAEAPCSISPTGFPCKHTGGKQGGGVVLIFVTSLPTFCHLTISIKSVPFISNPSPPWSMGTVNTRRRVNVVAGGGGGKVVVTAVSYKFRLSYMCFWRFFRRKERWLSRGPKAQRVLIPALWDVPSHGRLPPSCVPLKLFHPLLFCTSQFFPRRRSTTTLTPSACCLLWSFRQPRPCHLHLSCSCRYVKIFVRSCQVTIYL